MVLVKSFHVKGHALRISSHWKELLCFSIAFTQTVTLEDFKARMELRKVFLVAFI